MADMTDEAIAWTHNVRAANPGKPWFNFFSTSRVHAPHQPPKEYRDKYTGNSDYGWDRQRELTHARQLEIGMIPKGTRLTPRDPGIPTWDSRSADEKKVYARLVWGSRSTTASSAERPTSGHRCWYRTTTSSIPPRVLATT